MSRANQKAVVGADPAAPAAPAVHDDLYDQPGHLLRRAHQIAQGMFSEHVGKEVTPVQYAILRMVHEVPGVDQVTLAGLIGLDTSSTALAAARLETKGLLSRNIVETNRRQLRLQLTQEGEQLLGSLVQGVHTMRSRVLAVLPTDERELFVELLRKFVRVANEQSRAPLRHTVPRAASAKRKRK